MFAAIEYEYMARALPLAENGLCTTSPNPRVGCVVVRNAKVVGEGWHRRALTPSESAISDRGPLRRWILLLVFLTAGCTDGGLVLTGTVAAGEKSAAKADAAMPDVQDSLDEDWSGVGEAGGIAVEVSAAEPSAADANRTGTDADADADSSGADEVVNTGDADVLLDAQEIADAIASKDALIGDTPELVDTAVVAGNGDGAGDSSGADLAVACTLDAATWQGPPDTATLPGESTACAALGVAACVIVPSTAGDPSKNFKPDYSWKSYVCFNAAGKPVVSAVQHPKVNIDELPSKLPCTEAQLKKWLDAYQMPCWNQVPASAMPISTFAMLFDFAKIPQEVCRNVDGTRYRFTSGCAAYTYAIELDSPKQGPEPGDLFVGNYNGGYGWSGALWTIWTVPPDVTAFQANNPITGCKHWSPNIMSMQPYLVGINDYEPESVGQVAKKFWFSASYEKDIPKSLAAWSAVLAKLQVAFAKEPCKKM